MKKSITIKKAIFIIGFLFLFINISSLNGVYNLYYRFIITGLITFPLTYFLLKLNPFKKIGIFFIFFYFFVATPTVIFGLLNNIKTLGIVSYIIYLVASLFSIIVYKFNNKVLLSIFYFIIFFIGVYHHDNLMNFYYDLTEKNEIVNKQIPFIELNDSEGKSFSIKPNGKVQIIDFWSNSCAYCIETFPQYEEVFQRYVNDEDVQIYAVNVKLRDFNIDKANQYVSKYHFKNYFTDSISLKKLNFSSFPNYMIVSKKGIVTYFGSLNTSEKETYNNIYKLIENEK